MTENGQSNKIISFRKNDELLYRFNFNRNGLIKKATNVPEELVDVYKYNKNGDLIYMCIMI